MSLGIVPGVLTGVLIWLAHVARSVMNSEVVQGVIASKLGSLMYFLVLGCDAANSFGLAVGGAAVEEEIRVLFLPSSWGTLWMVLF